MAIKDKKQGRKFVIIFFIGLIVIYLIGNYMGSSLSKHTGEVLERAINLRNTPDTVLNKDWVRTEYGNSISVESPFQLIEKNIEISGTENFLLNKLNVFENKLKNGLQISLSISEYKPEAGVLDLTDASENVITNFKKAYDLTDLKYSNDSLRNYNHLAIKTNGTFQEEIINYSFEILTVKDDLKMWQMIIVYSTEDRNGRLLAKRIFNSIRI